MERESTKHGPALDEQLQHETEPLIRSGTTPGHSREDRREEDLSDGQDLGLIAGSSREELLTRFGITGTEATVRSDLAAHLAGVEWPADRDSVVAAAEADHADDGILEWLKVALPAGPSWDTFQDIWDALGGSHERRART